jgi:hypothetical protein
MSEIKDNAPFEEIPFEASGITGAEDLDNANAEPAIIEPTDAYFNRRMAELAINPSKWTIDLYNPEAEFPYPEVTQEPIFSYDAKGNIRILVYTITGELITYLQMGDGKMSHLNAKTRKYYITRLRDPKKNAKGEIAKYLLPKGQGTYPFFSPSLIQKFKDKEKITTLVMTEGYFKAAKGCMHNLDIVGLSSITHMKDPKTGALHGDIKKLIVACQVENVIWLQDGDCLDITSNDIEYADLYKRPHGFFQTVNTFRDLFSDYDCKKYFAHVRMEAIDSKPKGLDDMLVALKGSEHEVTADLLNLAKPPIFFYRTDVSFGMGALHKYFNLDSIDSFFLFHVQRRKELYEKAFLYHGTKYKYNQETAKVEVVVPGEAKNYFRVGDQYHAFVEIPNKYGDNERSFHRRMKGTINDDHGKKIFDHIPKYQAFCNVPDHVNYQPVINGCFNVYSPFEHEPEPGEWKNIEAFIKHIFGTADLKWTDNETKERLTINEYDLGLDYIQLLYQKPFQTLPILCLVSRENEPGKSTFAKFLKMIFTQNVAIVGNAELSNDFNASWAPKLIVACDEAKIDKQVVIEKIKMLSTAEKIFMNSKGKDHVEIDFFGKFIFISNNEDNFIYASEDDVRYWVRKIKRIEQLDNQMMYKLKEEIPAFLHYLNERKMVTPSRTRAWFPHELIKTDALLKVIAKSQGTFEKELRNKLRNTFLDFGVDTILMTQKDMMDEWFKFKYETNYMESVIKDKLKAETYHFYLLEGVRYESIEVMKEKLGLHATDELISKAEKKFTTKKYSYPRWERRPNGEGKEEMIQVWIHGTGRPYRFKKTDFLTPEEINALAIDPEMARGMEIMGDQTQIPLANTSITDDRPF